MIFEGVSLSNQKRPRPVFDVHKMISTVLRSVGQRGSLGREIQEAVVSNWNL